MSLERKDVRFKLAPDEHQALAVVAQADQTDIGEWVAELVNKEVDRRVHQARLIAEGTTRRGISGKTGERQGTPGSGA